MTVEDLIAKQDEEVVRQKGLKNRILCLTAARPRRMGGLDKWLTAF